MSEDYHFHFKVSTFPIVCMEMCLNSKKNYGQFEYFILQEGDLNSGYCSEKGKNDQYNYGKENLFDVEKSNKLLTKIKDLDKRLSESKVDYVSSGNNQSLEKENWLRTYKVIQEAFVGFGEIYFVMEPMTLHPLAEFVEKICERDGLLQDQVLNDISLAKNFSEEEKRLVSLLNKLGRYKLSLHSHMEPIVLSLYRLFDFISKVTKISLKEVIMMNDQEITDFLNGREFKIEEINKRLGGVILITGEKNPVLEMHTGVSYQNWKNTLEPDFVGVIKGTVACRGKVQGRVSLHLSWIHTTEIPKGNILVAGMTNPQMVPFIKNAGGIITDEGGLTCHAAIISREMKTPCIVGTKVATRVLKDGDLVEVDAEKGVVKIIKRV